MIACCLAVSGCAANTATYGTGQSAGNALAKDLGKIATFGFLEGSDEKEEISYHERQALVVPSKDGFKRPPQPVTGLTAEQIRLKREADAFIREYQAQTGIDTNFEGLTEEEIQAKKEANFEKEILASQREQDTFAPQDEVASLDDEVIGQTYEEKAEEELKKRSLFRRIVGKSVPTLNPLSTDNPLAEVPNDYRVVRETEEDKVFDAKKGKKKKRFLLF